MEHSKEDMVELKVLRDRYNKSLFLLYNRLRDRSIKVTMKIKLGGFGGALAILDCAVCLE